MASRNWKKLVTLGDGRVQLQGSFAPNGSSALVATNTKGAGFSVARSGTGVFTVTFQDVFPDFDCTVVQLASATIGSTAQVTSFSPGSVSGGVATPASLVITTITSGAAADIAAAAQTRVHFQVLFKNTTLPF